MEQNDVRVRRDWCTDMPLRKRNKTTNGQQKSETKRKLEEGYNRITWCKFFLPRSTVFFCRMMKRKRRKANTRDTRMRTQWLIPSSMHSITKINVQMDVYLERQTAEYCSRSLCLFIVMAWSYCSFSTRTRGVSSKRKNFFFRWLDGLAR